MARKRAEGAAVHALVSAAFALVPLIVLSIITQAVFDQAPFFDAAIRLASLAAFSSFLLVPTGLIYIGAYVLACKVPFRRNKSSAFAIGAFAFLMIGTLQLGIAIWLDFHGATFVEAPDRQMASTVNATIFWAVGASICGGSSILSHVLLERPVAPVSQRM